MKVILNQNVYNLIESGVTAYANKLNLSVIRNGYSYERIRKDAENNEKISILDDHGAFARMFKGFTKFGSVIQKENYVISPVKYDKDGNVISEQVSDTIAIITLFKDPNYDGDTPAPEPEPSEPEIDIQEYAAKVDYLLMLMD